MKYLLLFALMILSSSLSFAQRNCDIFDNACSNQEILKEININERDFNVRYTIANNSISKLNGHLTNDRAKTSLSELKTSIEEIKSEVNKSKLEMTKKIVALKNSTFFNEFRKSIILNHYLDVLEDANEGLININASLDYAKKQLKL
jgi:hypothetical protein